MGPTLCARLDDPYGSLNARVWPQGGTFGRARPPLRRPGDGCGCSAIAVLPTCRSGAAAGMLPWARNSCPSCSRKHDRAISIRPWDSFTNAIRHQRRRLRRRIIRTDSAACLHRRRCSGVQRCPALGGVRSAFQARTKIQAWCCWPDPYWMVAKPSDSLQTPVLPSMLLRCSETANHMHE